MNPQQAAADASASQTVMGMPVKTRFMFSNSKGVEKKGIKKRQLRLLKKLEFLPRFLLEGEEVLLVTTACSPISVMEQLTTGWILFYLKRALLVFTNKRILHIPTTTGYGYRHSIAQIGYNDIDSVKMGWGALRIRYRNGKSEKFLYIGRGERKKIRALMAKLKPGGQPSSYRQRYHLCPSCTSSLQVHKWTCPSCRLEFRNSSRARLLSILVPGGGYFYTGHWFLGLGDFIVETGLILIIVMPFFTPGISMGEAAVSVSFMFVILVIEKLITIYHAEHYIHEYIPVNKNYPKRASAHSPQVAVRSA
jgi:hypothetical protein